MKHYLLIILTFCTVLGYSQETDEKIKNTANDACGCISKINLDLSQKEKIKQIKECIKSAILGSQLQEKLFNVVNRTKDTLNKVDDITKIDTLFIDEGDIKIVLNDEENYKEIESFLYDNCPAMKQVYFTENQTHSNSYSDRKKAMKFYDEGQVAFSKEEYTKAITLFAKAVDKDKNFAFAWDNLGYSYRKVGNYKMAIECYSKSLALDPNGKMPLLNLPVAYELNNDIDNAILAYENLGKIYNDDPESPYGLGRMYLYKKDYENALENMIKAYIMYSEMNSPYNIDAQKNISNIYGILKDENKLEVFYAIAKKYNLQVNDED